MAAVGTKSRNTISLRGSAQIVSEFFNYAVNRCGVVCVSVCGRARARARARTRRRPPPPPPTHPITHTPTRTASILYQRGVYPQETFGPRRQYGLSMMVTKDEGLARYLGTVSKQMTGRVCCVAEWVCRRGVRIVGVRVVLWALWGRQRAVLSLCSENDAPPKHTPTHTHPQPTTPNQDWLARGLLQRLVLVITSAATREVLERWTFEVETDADVLAGGCALRVFCVRCVCVRRTWLGWLVGSCRARSEDGVALLSPCPLLSPLSSHTRAHPHAPTPPTHAPTHAQTPAPRPKSRKRR